MTIENEIYDTDALMTGLFDEGRHIHKLNEGDTKKFSLATVVALACMMSCNDRKIAKKARQRLKKIIKTGNAIIRRRRVYRE